MKHTILLGALLALAACNTEQVEVSSAPAFNIDAQRITVSGVSSGAYMAGQLHVAHSALFSGAALLAGGPYRCAAGNIQKALGACISGGDIDEPGLLEYARTAADAGQIDSLENLAHDPVWLFHAANDAVVSAEMTRAAASFYSHSGSLADLPRPRKSGVITRRLLPIRAAMRSKSRLLRVSPGRQMTGVPALFAPNSR